ncbi:MAG TPA: ATP-binding cassette domain-containing protein [Alphaproteobacteria bacterium]
MHARQSPLPLVLDRVSLAAGGVAILSDISLTLEAGPRTVILGPNGAGKSVLLRLCHGLLRPSSGAIEWRARRNGRRPDAMVFQRPIMLRRSVRKNVEYGLKLAGAGAAERRATAMQRLEAVGLAHLAGRPARRLSGGEQQRVALARAWALDPEVLFLDEPTANLDPTATRMVEAIMLAMHTGGTKIVMTTHDLGQARRLADEIVFLHRGRIVEHAPAAAFFAAPKSPEAAAFIRGELPV